MADEVILIGGKLVHAMIQDKVNNKIEKGILSVAHGVVLHQTGGGSAESSLSSYEGGNNGAHFLIDKDGTIYQTARIDQKCWHIGEIRSRCQELKTCTKEELEAVNAILFKKGEAYNVRVSKLHRHESGKNYPDRYPTNEDSIGIEIVGSFDVTSNSYETVTKEQNASLAWLIQVLEIKLSFSDDDVFTHPAVGYKQPSEASSAKWK